MHSKIEKNILSILLTISIIVLILASSLLLTIFDKKFYMDFEKEKNIQNKQEHIENLLNYFQNKDEYIQHPSFNQREVSHLYDVKNLIKKTYQTSLFFAILLISLLVYLFKTKNTKIISKSLFHGGTISLGIIILIIFLFSNFHFAFTLFHKLFFAQGTWLFAQQDLLIQLFPLTFFKKILTRILITASLASLIIIAIGIKSKNKL